MVQKYTHAVKSSYLRGGFLDSSEEDISLLLFTHPYHLIFFKYWMLCFYTETKPIKSSKDERGQLILKSALSLITTA